jgi:hypothetical protein
MQLQEENDGPDLQFQALSSQTQFIDKNGQNGSGFDGGDSNGWQWIDVRREQKAASDAGFAPVHVEIEVIFDFLECKRNESPDGQSRAMPLNSMFCLSGIEAILTKMMRAVFDKVKSKCTYEDVKLSSFLPEQEKDDVQIASKHSTARTCAKSLDKEGFLKLADAGEPLSLAELCAMLD